MPGHKKPNLLESERENRPAIYASWTALKPSLISVVSFHCRKAGKFNPKMSSFHNVLTFFPEIYLLFFFVMMTRTELYFFGQLRI